MFKSKAIHFLTALTFLFVSLSCPCASASTMASDEDNERAHHQKLVEFDCPHVECPDCESAEAIGCKTELVVPASSVVKVDLEDEKPILLAAHSYRFDTTPQLPTGPPGYLPRVHSASPVSRYDTQIK